MWTPTRTPLIRLHFSFLTVLSIPLHNPPKLRASETGNHAQTPVKLTSNSLGSSVSLPRKEWLKIRCQKLYSGSGHDVKWFSTRFISEQVIFFPFIFFPHCPSRTIIAFLFCLYFTHLSSSSFLPGFMPSFSCLFRFFISLSSFSSLSG